MGSSRSVVGRPYRASRSINEYSRSSSTPAISSSTRVQAPGRFTIELANLGARVHVGDISPVQLRLNAERVGTAGPEDAVVARPRLDICDLSEFADDTFDAVVCFGGPISYTMDRADAAVAELCRVTRPGGHVLVSVMSSLGVVRRFLPQVLAEGREFGPTHNDEVLETGDLARATNRGHECSHVPVV